MLAAALVAWLGSVPAPVPMEFRWEAPASCPDASTVRAHVEPLLGPPARKAGPVPRVFARVTTSDDAYHLRLTIHDGQAPRVREASAPDCDVLAEATTLIIATFVAPLHVVEAVREGPGEDPPLLEPPSPMPRARLPELTPLVEPAPPGPSPNRPPDSPSPDDELFLRAYGIAGRATQPDIDLGGALGVGWRRGPLHVALTLMALAPRFRTHPTLDGVGLRQSLYAASLRVCAGPRGPRWALGLCGGTELGAAVGTGTGVSRTRTAASAWGAAILGIQASVQLTPRWALWVGPEGVLTYAVSSFTVGDETRIEAGSGGIRGLLGVELRLR